MSRNLLRFGTGPEDPGSAWADEVLAPLRRRSEAGELAAFDVSASVMRRIAATQPAPIPVSLPARWAAIVVSWVTEMTPRAFGFLRSRWCCEVVALLLWQRHGVDVSRETVRRWLRSGEMKGTLLGDRAGWRIPASEIERKLRGDSL